MAIVGAGPAGLTAARELALLGYRDNGLRSAAGCRRHVARRHPRIPAASRGAGRRGRARRSARGRAEAQPALRNDFTVDGLLAGDYSAVFLATGLQKSAAVEVPGSELEGVVPAVELLRELNLGRPVAVGERVVVIGGGDVALDAARSAVRLQAGRGQEPQVTLAYRRTREEMPAADCRDRGGLRGRAQGRVPGRPVRRSSGAAGKVASIRLQRCELGEPDASGRRRPLPIRGRDRRAPGRHRHLRRGPGSRHRLPRELRRRRGGARPDRRRARDADDRAPGRFRRRRRRRDGIVYRHRGDRRPGAAPRRSIHNLLRGQSCVQVWEDERPVAELTDEELRSHERVPRVKMPALEPKDRRSSWQEVQLGFTAEQAIAEAKRCLNCAVCSECKSLRRRLPGERHRLLAAGDRGGDSGRRRDRGDRPQGVRRRAQEAARLSAASPTSSPRASWPGCIAPRARPEASSSGPATAPCRRRSTCSSASARATAPRPVTSTARPSAVSSPRCTPR